MSETRNHTRRISLRWVLWFSFANAIALSLIATRYFVSASIPSDLAGALFRALILPSHFLLLTGAVLPAVIIPTFLWPGLATRIWVIAVASACVALVLVDIRVFGLYHFHLNAMVWNLIRSGVADKILPLSSGAILRFAALSAGVAAGQVGLALVVLNLTKRQRHLGGKWIAMCALAIIILSQSMHAWSDVTSYRPITTQARYLPWLRPMTAYTFFERQGWVPARDQPIPIPAFHGSLRYPLAPMNCDDRSLPLNVLIVAIEEWRFDELDPVTSPKIWEFAERNIRFDNHWSTGNASRFGIFGLFYGLYGTYWDDMLAEQKGPVLIDEGIRRNARFGVYGSAPLNHPEFDRTVFAALRTSLLPATPGRSATERDRAITDRYLDFVRRESDRPFFAFLYYDSPHSLDYPSDLKVPYPTTLHELNHMDLGPDFDPAPLFDRHRNSIYYVDQLMGEVLDDLEVRGLLSRTAVIITGDHGEEFNDTRQNYWGHNSNFSRYQTQVPLVVHLPDRSPAKNDFLTSHFDVAPTLMEEAFGCTTDPALYSNGHSLLENDANRHVVAVNRHLGVGIIRAGELATVEPLGQVTFSDLDLHPLHSGTLSTAIVRDFIDQAGRFHRSE